MKAQKVRVALAAISVSSVLIIVWWWGSPYAAQLPGRVLSVCDLDRMGSGLNGRRVVLKATLIVDRLGGELRDARCPKVVVGFLDDGEAGSSEIYWRFIGSFDRFLMANGRARQQIKVEGVVDVPAQAGGERTYGSVVRLAKVLSFKPLDPYPR
jgi:hypothetical protein